MVPVASYLVFISFVLVSCVSVGLALAIGFTLFVGFWAGQFEYSAPFAFSNTPQVSSSSSHSCSSSASLVSPPWLHLDATSSIVLFSMCAPRTAKAYVGGPTRRRTGSFPLECSSIPLTPRRRRQTFMQQRKIKA